MAADFPSRMNLVSTLVIFHAAEAHIINIFVMYLKLYYKYFVDHQCINIVN